MLTISEATKKYSKDRKTIKKRIDSGKIKKSEYKKEGCRVFIAQSALDREFGNIPGESGSKSLLNPQAEIILKSYVMELKEDKEYWKRLFEEEREKNRIFFEKKRKRFWFF